MLSTMSVVASAPAPIPTVSSRGMVGVVIPVSLAWAQSGAEGGDRSAGGVVLGRGDLALGVEGQHDDVFRALEPCELLQCRGSLLRGLVDGDTVDVVEDRPVDDGDAERGLAVLVLETRGGVDAHGDALGRQYGVLDPSRGPAVKDDDRDPTGLHHLDDRSQVKLAAGVIVLGGAGLAGRWCARGRHRWRGWHGHRRIGPRRGATGAAGQQSHGHRCTERGRRAVDGEPEGDDGHMGTPSSHRDWAKAHMKSPSPPLAVSATAAEAVLKPCRYAIGSRRDSSCGGVWPLTPSCRSAVRWSMSWSWVRESMATW